jgi:hypothetical protein
MLSKSLIARTHFVEEIHFDSFSESQRIDGRLQIFVFVSDDTDHRVYVSVSSVWLTICQQHYYVFATFILALKVTESLLNGKNIVVLLTDGKPNRRYGDINTVIRVVTDKNKDLKASVYALGFGKGVKMDFLNKMSSRN